MSEDLRKTIEALEHTIHVLDEENSQLAERAEDSLLLGLISESIQSADSDIEIIESTLERIAILKAIPYTACITITEHSIKQIATYSTLAGSEAPGMHLTLNNDILDRLDSGPMVIQCGKNETASIGLSLFTPTLAVLVPFYSQAFLKGAFVFLDDENDVERLESMLGLLSRVVEMTISKSDNAYLLQALTESNTNLESMVAERTKDLKNTNLLLQQEMKERKASQQALLESHSTLTTVLDSLDALIFAANLENNFVLFMNKRMIDELGCDYTGKYYDGAYFTKEQSAEAQVNNRLLNADGTPAKPIVRQKEIRSAGKYFVVSDRAVKWTDGRFVRLQIATDITLIKDMENKLQHTQKMEAIGTLAGGIAHDFNNLLMGIQGRTSLVLAEMNENDPLHDHVSSIEKIIKSAANLTNQILGFARGGKYKVRTTDLNQLIINTNKMFGRTKKELVIRTKISQRPLIADVDLSQIEQVLLNLYINSWQAMNGGGEIRVTSGHELLDNDHLNIPHYRPGEYCCITVADDGIGMDQATLSKIFDPFFTTKEKDRGTGLGLASAYGIIKNHCGVITVESEIGRGTTFSIYLPVSEKKIHREKEQITLSIVGTETVLLTDDEEMIREIGKKMLEKLGYNVLCAKNGFEAIEIVQSGKQHIDLIVLDLVMPGIDGNQTFDRLKQINPTVPILLSSGYSINGQASEIMEKGCQGFLQKPFNLPELSKSIRRIFEKKAATEHNSS